MNDDAKGEEPECDEPSFDDWHAHHARETLASLIREAKEPAP